MANSVVTKVEMEGPRRALLRGTVYLDTSNLPITTIASIVPGQGYLPLNGLGEKLKGFEIERLQYSGNPPILAIFAWNSNTPRPFAIMSTRADIQLEKSAKMTPTPTDTGYDGSLVLYTQGYTAGGVFGFTFVLDLVKQYS